MATMRNRDADVYSDVADVLGMLCDPLCAYLAAMQDGDHGARDSQNALGHVSLSSINTTVTTEISTKQKYIREHVPILLDLCSSVQCQLHKIAFLLCQTSRVIETGGTSNVSDSETSRVMTEARNEIACALVTRKLGDVMENAHMMRGLVNLQQRQQRHKFESHSSLTSLRSSRDENDGAPRMEQLVRLMLYNLEETEQLLRIAYPEEQISRDVIEEGNEAGGRSPSLNSSVMHRTHTHPCGKYQSYNGSDLDREGSHANRRSTTAPPGTVRYMRSSSSSSSYSSSDTGKWGASPLSPRSSVNTTPYVQHSSSLDKINCILGSCASPSPVNHRSGSKRLHAVRRPSTNSPSSTGPHSREVILEWSGQTEPSSLSLHSTACVQTTPSRHISLPTVEPFEFDDQDSILCESVIGDTSEKPKQDTRAPDSLISNPVLPRGSTKIDDNRRSVNDHRRNTLAPLQRINSGDGCNVMQLAPFGYRRSSLTSWRRSPSSSASTISTTLTEIERFDTSSGVPTNLRPELANSATASILTMNTSLADALRANQKEALPRVLTPAGDRNKGDCASVPNHSTPPLGVGGAARALPVCVGLPPRSPRQQNVPLLPTRSLSTFAEEHPRDAPDHHPPMDPTARVTTHHTQRLPGELWGAIIDDHSTTIANFFREDLLNLFNYGGDMIVLQSADVQDVRFTAAGAGLDIRVQLEHYCTLSEAEINTRLNLCTYPLLVQLYEDFFAEYQANEFDSIQSSMTTTLGSEASHDSDAPSTTSRCASSREDAEEIERSHKHVEECLSSLTSGRNSVLLDAEGEVERCTSPSLTSAKSSKGFIEDRSAEASKVFSMPSGENSVETDGENMKGDQCDDSTNNALSGCGDEENVSLFSGMAVVPSVSRHVHTVRIPGAHWKRLLASSVPEKDSLAAAFVQDTGFALSVLPSEARATCQEIRFSSGSLIVDFLWDNAELYPGSVPLSALEIDTALQNCPFPSVRALYASACATLHLDNDLSSVTAAKRADSSGNNCGGALEPRAARLDLPNELGLRFAADQSAKLASDRRSRTEEGENAVTRTSTSNWEHTSPKESALQQRQRVALASSFQRNDSATSGESLEAGPRVAAPQPMAGPPTHLRKDQLPQRHEASRPVSKPHFGNTKKYPATATDPSKTKVAAHRTMPNPSQNPKTLSKPAAPQRLSECAPRHPNPPLLEQEAGIDIPTARTVCASCPPLSSPRAHKQTEPSAASGVMGLRNPTESGPAALKNTTPRDRTASSTPHTSPLPASPSLTLAGPKPPGLTMQQKTEKSTAVPNITKTASPVVAASLQPTPLHTEHTSRHSAPLKSTTRSSAASSSSSMLETSEAAAVQVPLAVVPVTEVPSQQKSRYSTDSAPISPHHSPRITESSSKASEPECGPLVSTTSSTARDRISSLYTVYRLSSEHIAGMGEPRGIEAIWTTDSAHRRFQDGKLLHTDAVDDTHAAHEKHSIVVGSSNLLWVRELGLQLDHLTVVQVRRGSAAARANVQPGDTLRAVEGKMLLSQRDLQSAVSQQQLRHEDGERIVFLTAVTSRGVPAMYRLRIPPFHHDTAAAQPDGPSGAGVEPVRNLKPVSHPRSGGAVRQSKPTTPRQPISSPNHISTPAGCALVQQQQPPHHTKHKVARAPARRSAPVSARARVSSIDARRRESARCTSRTSGPLLRHTEAPDLIHSVATGWGRAGVSPQSL